MKGIRGGKRQFRENQEQLARLAFKSTGSVRVLRPEEIAHLAYVPPRATPPAISNSGRVVRR